MVKLIGDEHVTQNWNNSNIEISNQFIKQYLEFLNFSVKPKMANETI